VKTTRYFEEVVLTLMMKITYYPDTDTLYLDFAGKPGVDALEMAAGVVLDVDAEGDAVGIEIEHASARVDLARLDTESLPASSLSLVAR
jgi:uncharacterized protein YuzE